MTITFGGPNCRILAAFILLSSYAGRDGVSRQLIGFPYSGAEVYPNFGCKPFVFPPPNLLVRKSRKHFPLGVGLRAEVLYFARTG
jgi:hypothetical protein